MRTNLTDDSKIITLWPAESISRGDRSRLPFRRIWQSTRPNFSPCSQPQHFRTLPIFSYTTLFRSGLILLTIPKSSHSGPQSRSLAGTGVVCPFAESISRLDAITPLALNPSISGHFREYFRGRPPDAD